MRATALKSFLIIGLTGLTITVALNLVAWFVLKRHSAECFSSDWWSSWFPNYTVWLTFSVVGWAVRMCR
jgi:ABC-type transporter Mla maintaining outer membrane lipid asymmetry permease subunit MlaE